MTVCIVGFFERALASFLLLFLEQVNCFRFHSRAFVLVNLSFHPTIWEKKRKASQRLDTGQFDRVTFPLAWIVSAQERREDHGNAV